MRENEEGFFQTFSHEFEKHVYIFNTVLWLANFDSYLFLRNIYRQKVVFYNKKLFIPEKNHP
jgi:hypothetical protein